MSNPVFLGGKIRKRISVCLLLKTLTRVLSVKVLVLCVFVAGSCGCWLFFFILFVFFSLYLVGLVCHCDHLTGENGTGCFDFCWFVVT